MKATPGKKVEDLTHNPDNPRSITDSKLELLGKSMDAFGDISGIVFNCRTGVVIGGTQRTKRLSKRAKVKITKTWPKPTAKGTVAIGYVEHNGERFSYREVDWDADTQEAAMIAANNNAGSWEKKKLTSSMRKLGSFDKNFDLDLTMFDAEEIKKKFSTVTVSEHQRSAGGDDEDDSDDFAVIPGETYAFGPHRLTVGNIIPGEPSVEPLFRAWLKATGQRPMLLNSEESIEEGTELEESSPKKASSGGGGGGVNDGPKPLARARSKKPKTIGFSSLTSR